MRHRIADQKFNRDANARKGFLKSLLRALLEQGSITTTAARAKAVRRLADRVIARGQDDSINTRRLLHRDFGRRDVVNTVVDRIAPTVKDRKSGFTTLTVIGKRHGDNAPMVKVALVKPLEKTGFTSGKTHKHAEKAKSAAKPVKTVEAAVAPKAVAKAKATTKAKAK